MQCPAMRMIFTLAALAFVMGCGSEKRSAFQDAKAAFENQKDRDFEIRVVDGGTAAGEQGRTLLILPMSNAVPAEVEQTVSVVLTNLLDDHPGLGYARDGAGWRILLP